MRTCIVERGSTPIPHSHPLIVAGCVLPYDNDLCDWNARTAAENWRDREALHAAFPDRIIVDKYHGLGKASWDACNHDTTGKCTTEQLFPGLEAGRINVAPDLDKLRDFARMYAKGTKAEIVMVDDEAGLIPHWYSASDADPEKVLKDAADERRSDLVVRIFQSSKCRAQMGENLKAIPRDRKGILDAFNPGLSPNYENIQREASKWWMQLRVKAVKEVLQGAGIYPCSVQHAFIGAWLPSMKDQNGHTLPKISLPGGWCSNTQWYQGDTKKNREILHPMSKAVRFWPTFSGDMEPDVLADQLWYSAPNGAVIWVENPDRAERLAPVVRDWIGT